MEEETEQSWWKKWLGCSTRRTRIVGLLFRHGEKDSRLQQRRRKGGGVDREKEQGRRNTDSESHGLHANTPRELAVRCPGRTGRIGRRNKDKLIEARPGLGGHFAFSGMAGRWIWTLTVMILVAKVRTQSGGVDLDEMMDFGWKFNRTCELSLLPLMTAMDMVAQKIHRQATEDEQRGGRPTEGRTYARTGKLARIYDQAQEFILDALKNKRF
jgi:hypothetical protein